MHKQEQGFSFIGFFVLCLVIGGIGYAALQVFGDQVNAPAEDTGPKQYSATENWDDVNLSDADAERKQHVLEMSFKAAAYRITKGGYPKTAADAQTMQETGPIIDPETTLAYTIVDTEPLSVGQMQYKVSATCDSLNRVFEPVESPYIYAFRVRLSEGSFICKSNIR